MDAESMNRGIETPATIWFGPMIPANRVGRDIHYPDSSAMWGKFLKGISESSMASKIASISPPTQKQSKLMYVIWSVLHIFIHAIVAYYVVSELNRSFYKSWEIEILYSSLVVTAILYTMLVWSDPGFIAKQTVPPLVPITSDVRVCSTCNIVRPLRSKHCSQCGRCVLRMDHHCAWIGLCVGEGNHLLFFMYIVVQTMHLFWAVNIVLRFLIIKHSEVSPHVSSLPVSTSVLLRDMYLVVLKAPIAAFLLVLISCGAIFTVSVIFAQCIGISTNVLINESLNRRREWYSYLNASPNPFSKGFFHNWYNFVLLRKEPLITSAVELQGTRPPVQYPIYAPSRNSSASIPL